MILEDVSVAITPFRDGYRIGSTMELAGHDATLDRRRLDHLRRGAGAYLHEPTAAPALEDWAGLRPMTFDDLPRLGRSPRFANVWIAAGHGMLGLSMGPATGRLMAELVTGRTPHVDPAPFRPARA
jgi:D-amino-acid dehydrogenase